MKLKIYKHVVQIMNKTDINLLARTNLFIIFSKANKCSQGKSASRRSLSEI